MEQLNLFDGITNDKFPQYHTDNPHIYEAFKKYTFEAINAGRKRFSAEAVINRLRWETLIAGNDKYKINNNYKPFYSRMFMNEFPNYKGIFSTRTSKYDVIAI